MLFYIDKLCYQAPTGHYTIAELAEELGASTSTVRAALIDGTLPFIRGPSGELLIPKDFVERWLFCS